jgi:DNA-binding IclR family transcriptional regulator
MIGMRSRDSVSTLSNKKRSSRSLDRSLDILECFGPREPELGLGEVARRVRLPKSTTHRFLTTMVRRGYVMPVGVGRYRLGIRLWELGCVSVTQFGLRETARPTIEWLARESQETVHLAVLDGREIVYIDTIDSTQPVQAYSRIGGRMPAFCVATGKAMLACQPGELLADFMRGGLPRYTPRTITDPDRLRKDLARVPRDGYAVNLGEYRRDVGGVAAPIKDHTGGVVGAVGVTAPVSRLPRARVRALAPLVVRAAAEISERLGHLGESRRRSVA